MNTAAGQRVQIDRKRGDKRLAFTGLHLGNLAFVENHPADQLDIEMPLPKRALGSFPNGRKGGDQDVVE